MAALNIVELCEDNVFPNGSILVPSSGCCRLLPQGGKGASLGGMAVENQRKVDSRVGGPAGSRVARVLQREVRVGWRVEPRGESRCK